MKGKVVFVLLQGCLDDFSNTSYDFDGVFERSDDAIEEIKLKDKDFDTYKVRMYKDEIYFEEAGWLVWCPWKIITTTIL